MLPFYSLQRWEKGNQTCCTIHFSLILLTLSGFQSFLLLGSYSSKVLPVTSPKTASWKTHSQSGKTEYPSWVSSLGKEYPSWVEDLDTTTRENKVKYRYLISYTHYLPCSMHYLQYALPTLLYALPTVLCSKHCPPCSVFSRMNIQFVHRLGKIAKMCRWGH